MSSPPSKKLRELFLEAAEIEHAAARAAFLNKACGGDALLRQRLEELLAADEAAGPAPGRQPGTPMLANFLASQLTERPGDTIGRYKLREKLGEGGCGVVYMAEQEEPVRRKVALKIIKLGMDTKQVVARFEAERQALAMMDHLNIAKVLDAGATDAGRPYFVMELVGGIKITDYCEQNQLTTRQRLDLFIQVCHAIQHAHQKGVIHRDIKPSNILVATQDGVPVPKVIDFGIAKATQGKLTDQTVFTAFEQFLGTPAYMSPEQAQLGALDVDTRSDVYSLGVLLYELLTGKTPFDAKELLAVGLEAMRKTICEKEPPTPSTRLKQDLATQHAASPGESKIKNQKSKIANDLDWIVMKCLEKDRARRYETANSLATDIARHLKNEPVVARPPSRLYEFQKTFRRHKVGFVATGAVVAALSCAVVVSVLQVVHTKRAERTAERANRTASERLWGSYLAEALRKRFSGKAGQRFESLAALSNAAVIRPSLELRTEAIACMALTDVRLVNEKHPLRGPPLREHCMAVDAAFQRYAASVFPGDGSISIRGLWDDKELLRIPSPGTNLAWVGSTFIRKDELFSTVYADFRTRVWDLSSAKLYADIPWLCEFSADGKLAAEVHGASTNITLYDLAARKKLKTITPSEPIGEYVVFHPDNSLLACVMPRTNILVLDTRSGSTLARLAHPMPVSHMAWHPDGSYLAVACADGLIYLWDTNVWAKVRTLEGHKAGAETVSFSHDGRLLLSAGLDGNTVLWDFQSGRRLLVYSPGGGAAMFGPDDRMAAGFGWDLNRVQLFELASGSEVRAIYDKGRTIGAPSGNVFFSNDGRWLAFDADQGASVWDVEAQRTIGERDKRAAGLFGFDASNQSVLGAMQIGDDEYRIFRWPFRSPATNREGPAPEFGARCIGLGCVSPDGRLCVAIGEYPQDKAGRTRAQVLRTDTLSELARTDFQVGMRHPAFSPDGRLLATGCLNGRGVKVWEAQTGKLVKDLPIPEGEDKANVAFSQDGHRLVVGTSSQYQFWEVGNWSPSLRIAQLPGAMVTPVMAFSPDGSLLAGTFAFTKVRLFKALTGEILGDLEPPNSYPVTSLSFSPDGTLLAVSEGQAALHLWDLRAIRQGLAQMRLDWDLPPYPPNAVQPAKKNR